MKYAMVAVMLVALAVSAMGGVVAIDVGPGALIPCPECGSSVELVQKGSKVRVECTAHPNKHRGPKCDCFDEAVDKWNAQVGGNHQGD